ncbi:hypothetical protein C0Q70_06037 [Pomacea canaliculata]|uniref:dCMP deaminase n=1 Tax=Pomacea canaliculata TaxID=400727 RepID=A0A2T7PMW3_POMCA|nr:hypothetical protein C0Q70_06037 [Pomacea canaliculata]
MNKQGILFAISNKVSNGKRADYLSWDEYFMATAFLSAQRSKDPRTQVGACIVNSENKIVGIGYNGMPIGCSDDLLPWHRDPENILESKQLYDKDEFKASKKLLDMAGIRYRQYRPERQKIVIDFSVIESM